MARTEAQKRAQKDYMAKVRQVMVKFNTVTEAEELAWLESKGQMQTYIKELIRRDMMNMNIYRIEDEAGDALEGNLTYEETQSKIAEYEAEDRQEGGYEKGRYYIRNTKTDACERVINI